MQAEAKSNLGAFRDSGSYLHQFDARLKLLLLCCLVSCLFSAISGWRLMPLFLLWLVGAKYCPNGWRDGVRVVALMRWLLLFTLLLHLFFTPGRTLFGTSWLSYDGLLRGLLVDGQLVLAVLFSMLLAWTTKPEQLTWGLTSCLSPLQRFKIPVREAGGLLLLVLQFFPIIRDELSCLQPEKTVLPQRGLAGIKAKANLVVPLLMRLLDRADMLAKDIAVGGQACVEGPLMVDRSLCRFDWTFFASNLMLLLLIWGV